MATMGAMPSPCMVKTLQKSYYPEPVGRLQWNLVGCIEDMSPHHLFKSWSWVDLDLFYTKVKFDHLSCYIGKNENSLFFENNCSLWSRSWKMHWKKMILWPYMSIRGQGHSLTFTKGHSVFKLKSLFLKSCLVIWNHIPYERFLEHGNENSYKWAHSYYQYDCHVHIW